MPDHGLTRKLPDAERAMAIGEIEGSEPTPIQREACRWMERLALGDVTEADAVGLQRWCELDPAHAAAFSEASQFWGALGPAGQSLRDDDRTAALARQDTRSRRYIGRRAVIGGAAAAAAGFMVIHPPLGLWPSFSELAADYRTGTGEQRKLVISDGVAIQMNTRTSISIHANRNGDAIELVAGEASFTMPDSQAKRFSVVAAGGKATGAKFDIRCLAVGARVTCLEEGVQVTYQGRTVTLSPQQSVSYGNGAFGSVSMVDAAVVTAWQNGLLIFNMTPLSEVIGELNRYRTGRIILMNASLAHMPVNGRFLLDDPDLALTQIEQAFGVHGRVLPGGIVLLT